MKTLLLSHKISKDTPLYGGKRKVKITQDSAIKKGNSSNSLNIDINTHTSTHIDLPNHFIEGGKVLDNYASDFWNFKNIALKEMKIDIADKIDEENFANAYFDENTDLLIIKTGFEKYRGKPEYVNKSPVVSSRLAEFLREKFPKLKAVGFDFISISSLANREEGRKAHEEFLGRDILIIEDMKLSKLTDKPDSLLVSPLFVEGAGACPVSVWAFYEELDLNKCDYIYFDFDGVILDSVNIKTEAFKVLYKEYGSNVVDKVIKHHLINGGMSRYKKFKLYHKEFLGIDLSKEEIERLAQKFSQLVFEKVLKAKFIEGALEFLNTCLKYNKTCFIVSGTPEEEIKIIIKGRKLIKYFKEIKGTPTSKEENVNTILKKYKIDRNKAVFFGDAINDIKAANKNSLKFIGINIDSAISYKNLKIMGCKK